MLWTTILVFMLLAKCQIDTISARGATRLRDDVDDVGPRNVDYQPAPEDGGTTVSSLDGSDQRPRVCKCYSWLCAPRRKCRRCTCLDSPIDVDQEVIEVVHL
ncbi:hypothetical protein Btru_044112 [Bulinus truncatus]|nr:hypothetical protein Btru_044112 [Bulinus truncatus]